MVFQPVRRDKRDGRAGQSHLAWHWPTFVSFGVALAYSWLIFGSYTTSREALGVYETPDIIPTEVPPDSPRDARVMHRPTSTPLLPNIW